VDGYGDFTRGVAREVAAGLGITYEALTGDLSNVNFSSARMGRMEMDRNVSDWQNLLAVPIMMDRIAAWFVEAWDLVDGLARAPEIGWTPPRRVLVDPTKELPAMGEAVRLGFQSRSSVIRSLGYDPERVMEEIAADNREADRLGLGFDSDGRRPKSGGAGASQAAGRTITEIEDESETRGG
jgi:capsid protein